MTDVVNDLIGQGYIFNFHIHKDSLVCVENNLLIPPEEFEIDHLYRFQEMSDVDDEAIIYAISSQKNGLKGLLINAFGIYAEENSAKLAAKLSVRKNS